MALIRGFAVHTTLMLDQCSRVAVTLCRLLCLIVCILLYDGCGLFIAHADGHSVCFLYHVAQECMSGPLVICSLDAFQKTFDHLSI